MKTENQSRETLPTNILLKLSWDTSIKMLSIKERGEVFTNIFNYHTGEELLPLSKMAQMFFSNAIEVFEYNIGKYQSKVIANRENGLKGGRPRLQENQNPKGASGNPINPNGFLENPNNHKDKGPDKGKGKDTDRVIDCDTEKDIVTGRIKETDPRFRIYYLEKFKNLLDVIPDTLSNQDDRTYVQRANLLHRKLGLEVFSKLIFEPQSEEAQEIINAPEFKLNLSDLDFVRYHMIGCLRRLVK